MNKCRKCGRDLGDSGRPCPSCKDLEENTYSREEVSQETKDIDLSLGQILAILGLSIAIVGMFFLMKSSLSKEGEKDKLINRFIAAVDEDNPTELTKILKGQEDLIIDKAGAEAFIRLMKSNDGFYKNIKLSLEEQSKYYDENREDIGDYPASIILRKDRGHFRLLVKPYYLRINLPVEGVDISLNDKLIDRTEIEDYVREFGPYMPGLYDVEASMKTDFQQADVLKSMELFECQPKARKITKDLDISFKLKDIKIESEYDNAEIILNGKKIGKKLKELKDSTLKNLDESVRIQLEVDTIFGKFLSKEETVGDLSKVYYLDVEIDNSKLKDDVISTINSYERENLEAKNSRDLSKYSNLTGEILEEKKQLIAGLKEGDKTYSLIQLGYDLDTIKASKKDGSYYANALIREDALEESQGKSRQLESYHYIRLKYRPEEKQWKIYEIKPMEGYTGENIKTYKM